MKKTISILLVLGFILVLCVNLSACQTASNEMIGKWEDKEKNLFGTEMVCGTLEIRKDRTFYIDFEATNFRNDERYGLYATGTWESTEGGVLLNTVIDGTQYVLFAELHKDEYGTKVDVDLTPLKIPTGEPESEIAMGCFRYIPGHTFMWKDGVRTWEYTG